MRRTTAGAVRRRCRALVTRRRDQRGFAGGFAGLLFGCLLFVGGTLLVSYT